MSFLFRRFYGQLTTDGGKMSILKDKIMIFDWH